MRKILVSGCINCPYLTVYNDGQGDGVDSIVSGECKHPSYHKELLNPKMNPTVFIDYVSDEGEGKASKGQVRTPDWCPLPNN